MFLSAFMQKNVNIEQKNYFDQEKDLNENSA
jgi:hypothetical protein